MKGRRGMRIVAYVVREGDLSIQSSNCTGFRWGWLEDSWVIDIGFAQQWLIYYRQLSVSVLLPMQRIHSIINFYDSFPVLLRIYHGILKEDWSNLLIHGEPISLPVQDVQLLPPLIEPNRLIIPTFLCSKEPFLHASSILWPNLPIANVKKALPGIGFMLGNQFQLIGCSLINYWLKEGEWIPSLGPSLFMTDQWQSLKNDWLTVRRNDQIVDQQKIELWEIYEHLMKTKDRLERFTPGNMISTVFDSSITKVEAGDQLEIEMGYLGRLQNGVDKT